MWQINSASIATEKIFVLQRRIDFIPNKTRDEIFPLFSKNTSYRLVNEKRMTKAIRPRDNIKKHIHHKFLQKSMENESSVQRAYDMRPAARATQAQEKFIINKTIIITILKA